MWRHACAWKRAFGCGWYRHELLRLLEKHLLVLMDSLHHLARRHVVLFGTALKSVDVAAVLILHFCTLLSQSCALLFSSLLGGKAFSIGGNETIVLLVKSNLTLLKTVPLLKCCGHVGLDTLHLALDLGFDGVEVASDGVLVVTLLLPCCLRSCGLLSFFLWNISKIVGLKGKVSCSVIGLANVLGELEDTLALTLITSSGIGKTVTEIVDLLSNGSNGGLVVLLVPLQAVTELLQLLVCRGD